MACAAWGSATSTSRAPAASRRGERLPERAPAPPRRRPSRGSSRARRCADPWRPPCRAAREVGHGLRRAGGVARVAAEEHGGGEGGVLHRAREGADLVERRGEGDEAVAADPAVGRLQADHAAQRGGLADRAAGVGAEGERRHARGHRGRGAARGAAGDARRVPGVARRPVGAVLGGRAHRELVHVRLARPRPRPPPPAARPRWR